MHTTYILHTKINKILKNTKLMKRVKKLILILQSSYRLKILLSKKDCSGSQVFGYIYVVPAALTPTVAP